MSQYMSIKLINFGIYSALTTLLFLISGCNIDVESTVYVRDVLQVGENNKPIFIPATLTLEIPNARNCQEYQEKVIPILRKYDKKVKFLECKNIKGNISDVMAVRIELAVISRHSDEYLDAEALVSIVVSKIDNFSTVHLLTTDYIDDLEKELNNIMLPTVDLSDVLIRFTLVNDTRDNIYFSTAGSFVDSDPIPLNKPFKLAQRHEAIIELSNVSSKHLLHYGYVFFAVISDDETQTENNPLFFDWNNTDGPNKASPKEI